jgi:hypothetical protein
MDLASASDQLYGGSLEDFIDRRKALVADARAAKDRALATAIGKLRKPTRSAYLVNLYARRAPEELRTLLDLGAALQAAQQQLSVADLRRLSGERQKTLAAATRSAVALGEDEGYTATEAVRQEVTQTLQAALADPGVAEQVRSGTVTEAHAYGGFGVFGLGSPPETSVGSEPVVALAATDADNSEDAEAEHAETAAAAARAEQRLRDAEAALNNAADDAEEATARADELAEKVEALRKQLEDAEGAEAEARQRARAARKTVTECQAEVQAAREAYEAL